jgi:hypothetical protein
MNEGIATDCSPWNSIAARTASWNRGVKMSVTGIIPGRPYNTQSDGDHYAMCVSECLSVTPLHSVVDVRSTPEKYQFFQRQAAADWNYENKRARQAAHKLYWQAKTLMIRTCGTIGETFPQAAQKGLTSHPPNPGAPRRALSQTRPQLHR